ncbi:hypothetical protein GGTG_01085 [Gaeumannomyces tritici R3-111a-1]|uniref:Phosphomethylpyrimidine kinase n=1 Tax=Gaeumannomyces tritici (strain R3-111a-1) TaxID=644352 RepID=J3NIK6_GAET3|nr:hypothetical protein GGTG_01085 [Gaeumannomyces tritici R3-111a-1]EJT81099.1 hypothetical protein GGTG_01085 [Gaeumannomyces tritici R3-111a-1]
MSTKGRVLVIAGSDSSGGAGLEADQKVLAAHGCYAMTATTALTAQNTKGVVDIFHISPEFVRKQIDACFDDIGVDVVKTGMLASVEAIEMVAEALRTRDVSGKLVVDPVMVATSGAQLLPPTAASQLTALILPQTTLLTPNIPEASLLLTRSGQEPPAVKTVGDMEVIGRALQGLGPDWVLVKGGHAPLGKDYTVVENPDDRRIVVDVLVGPWNQVLKIESAYQNSRHTHGTGCSLASAVAANLANGMEMPRAVKAACRYIEAAIKAAPGLGQGNGPLGHFHSLSIQPFALGNFIEYLLERPDVAPLWQRYTRHPFVMGLGDASLPLESFKSYLVQDYLYLIQFARANSLAAYKAANMKDIAASAAIVLHIDRETRLHLEYCKSFGLLREDIERAEEHPTCTAYSRYILDVGHSSDWLALQVALAPCLLGYGAIAQHLHADQNSKREGNPYWSWIQNYVADDYVLAVKTGSELLERHAIQQSPTRVEELVQVFKHAVKMEIAFWEMFPSSPATGV